MTEEFFSNQDDKTDLPARSKDKNQYSHSSLARCSCRKARALVKYEFAYSHEALPLSVLTILGQSLLTVASSNPNPEELIQSLKFTTNMEIKIVKVDSEVLKEAIFTAYHGDEEELTQKLKPLEPIQIRSMAPAHPDIRSQESDLSKLLAALIDYGIAHSASDIHLLPLRNGTQIKMRIGGLLHERDDPICTPDNHGQIVRLIKVMAKLDISSAQLPQDGSFKIPVGERTVSIRVSILPTFNGEKVVLRLLGGSTQKELESLGFDSNTLGELIGFTQKREGVLLLCGPTGSGKTTTLYSVVKKLQQNSLSIATIEDPIECEIARVSQTAINPEIGLDYTICLRSVLRQDPDVILVGEVRDAACAQIALQAALTGHLMLTTIHARNVFEVFIRLTHLGCDHLSIAQSLSLIVCQRLIPALCKKCRVIDLSGTHQIEEEIYREVGCNHCDYTGFLGRALASEALVLSQALKDQLVFGKISINELSAHVEDSEYLSMNSSLAKLLFAGKISLKQAQALGYEPTPTSP